MPIKTADGSPGLLASCTLGEAVKTLPDLSWAIEKHRDDLPLMNAIYRDYSFLASAYLLEPCESLIRNEFFINVVLTLIRSWAFHEGRVVWSGT